MPWEDRLRQAAYSSAQGTRIEFQYENVSLQFSKKTSAFDFPDADGTYVQDNGATSNRFPLRIFFWGDDHDRDAEIFEEILRTPGVGKLEHPFYGSREVVPFGAITRRDDLKTAANQSVFEVTFWETIGIIYPQPQDDPGSSLLQTLRDYNDAIATQFSGEISLGDASEQAGFKAHYQNLLDTTREGLDAIANTNDFIENQFNSIYDSINTSIDVLVERPVTLAAQTVALIQSPARALDAIQARLRTYGQMLDTITGKSDDPNGQNIYQPGLTTDESNDFHTDDLYASTYVSAKVLSVINTTFETQTAAIEAADDILTSFAQLVTWRDDNYESLEQIDTGETYQQLQEAVAVCAGFLVQISFTLRQERRIVLDRPRAFTELCGELYGQTDEIYDFFIQTNDLAGDEYFVIPEGREVVYYV